MLNIVQTATHKNKTYHLAETQIGKILFCQFGDLTQYKNITNHDICWNIKPTDEFEWLFNQNPIRTITSKKAKDMKVVHKFSAGDTRFQVLEKSLSDGYYYVIDHTHMRLFPEQKYPKAKYIYQMFHKESLRTFDYSVLQRTFAEETARFNGDHSASPYIMSTILDEVSRLASSKEEETEEMQVSLF